jgi:hypothetical protein
LQRIAAAALLTGAVLWLALKWLEQSWLPANLRERWRRSRGSQP